MGIDKTFPPTTTAPRERRRAGTVANSSRFCVDGEYGVAERDADHGVGLTTSADVAASFWRRHGRAGLPAMQTGKRS